MKRAATPTEIAEWESRDRQTNEQPPTPPTPLTRVRWIPLDSVRSAVEALGFNWQDLREVRIGVHDVTVSHNHRHEGKLTGIVITQTVPIDRQGTPPPANPDT